MILTATQGSEASSGARYDVSYVETSSIYETKRVKSAQKPTGTKVPYKFDRKVLSLEGGRVLIHLRKPLMVEVDPESWTCFVQGWNITIPAGEIANLATIASRRFLTLFSKADRGELSSDEKQDWVSILDFVDYRRFSVDRAPARYLEGELTDRQPNFVRVRWHDGESQKITGPVCSSLDVLTIGDEFSAYVKLGVGDVVKSIERLSILSPV